MEWGVVSGDWRGAGGARRGSATAETDSQLFEHGVSPIETGKRAGLTHPEGLQVSEVATSCLGPELAGEPVLRGERCDMTTLFDRADGTVWDASGEASAQCTGQHRGVRRRVDDRRAVAIVYR